MQYILSEEEYQKLKFDAENATKLVKDLPSVKELQKFATYVADTMPVKWGWSKDEEAKPWGCIITIEKENNDNEYPREWYCDSCPSQNICPYKWKSWSK